MHLAVSMDKHFWDTQHTHTNADKLCGNHLCIKLCIYSTITIWIFLYCYHDSEFYIDISVYRYIAHITTIYSTTVLYDYIIIITNMDVIYHLLIIICNKNIFAVKKAHPRAISNCNHNCNWKVWYLVWPRLTLLCDITSMSTCPMCRTIFTKENPLLQLIHVTCIMIWPCCILMTQI